MKRRRKPLNGPTYNSQPSTPAQFDHVITAAKIGKDLVWLDATAEVAPFGMLLYPLRDKQALLVADDATAGLHKTTAVSPYKNSMSISMEGKFSEAGAFDASVDMTATGDDAVPLRMAFRSTSEVDWQKLAEILSWSQGLRGKISDLDVTPFDDASKPFRLRYKYHDDSYFTVPTAGVDFNPFPPIGLIRLPRKKKNEPIDIGPIGEVHQQAHLQFPNNYTLNVPPEVRMTRDYGAWTLSGSGTVANRLARVYQKALQAEKAKHFLALAVAAGGADAEDSRSRLVKLGASAAPTTLAQSQAELLQIRTIKLPGMTGKKGEAEFTLVFDGSSKPERVEFRGGELTLRDAEQGLTNATYPVMFPDRSSIKIVRRGTLTCTAAGCAVALKPLESVQPSPLMLAGSKN